MMKILSQGESSKSGYWWDSSQWWNFISRMNIHHVKFVIIEVLMGINTLCSCKLSCIRYFHYYSGWVVRKIKNKDQLSPAGAEVGAELGNIL